MGMMKAFTTAVITGIESTSNTFTTTLRTTEKSVQLVEREVDNLAAHQNIRLAKAEAERQQVIKDEGIDLAKLLKAQ